ncbi:uncharacterized protein TNCV_2795621 [Trichonephila clavipes]|nr:uncharacterized protein TNCV_2795621 [Trichonephila clavipes]
MALMDISRTIAQQLIQCPMDIENGKERHSVYPTSACNITMVGFKFREIVSMLAQRLPCDTPPTATPDQLWPYVEAAWTAVPKGYIQSLFGSMPKCFAAVIANNDDYSNY